jgi:hypothetical protein
LNENEPLTLDEVSDEIVSEPLPNVPPAFQLPIVVVPVVVTTAMLSALWMDTVVVPTAALESAKAIETLRSALFEATFRLPFVSDAALTMPL